MRTLAAIAVCLFAGCVSRPHLDTRTFAFATRPPPAQLSGSPNHRLVAIRCVRLAAPFDNRSFVYRTGENSFESDPYAEFVAPCSETLLSSIRAWMRQRGCFESVVEPGSALRPNTVVEIYATELYGDFRVYQRPAAVLSLKFVVFDAMNGIPQKVVLEREYSQRLEIKSRTAAALVAGWNQELDRTLDEFDSEIRALDPIVNNDNKPE